jgi:hypothetical protein
MQSSTLIPFSITINATDPKDINLRELKIALGEMVAKKGRYLGYKVKFLEFMTAERTIGAATYKLKALDIIKFNPSVHFRTENGAFTIRLDGMIAMETAEATTSDAEKTVFAGGLFGGGGLPVGYKASVEFFDIIELSQDGSYGSIGEANGDYWVTDDDKIYSSYFSDNLDLGELGGQVQVSLKNVFRKIQKFPNIKLYAGVSRLYLKANSYKEQTDPVQNVRGAELGPVNVLRDDNINANAGRVRFGITWDF